MNMTVRHGYMAVMVAAAGASFAMAAGAAVPTAARADFGEQLRLWDLKSKMWNAMMPSAALMRTDPPTMNY